MRHWYTMAEKQDGVFEVVHSWTYEDLYIGDCFDESCYDIEDMAGKINAGDLDWFVVRVQYFYDGQEAGSDYLGGCLYESVEKAFASGLDGYLEDMEDCARKEAQAWIQQMARRIRQDFPELDTARA